MRDEPSPLGPSEEDQREEDRGRAYARVMTGTEFTKGEKRLLEWQMHRASGFVTELMRCLAAADANNLDRLSLGFPEEAAAMRAWKQGNLAQRFEAAGVKV